MVPSLGGISNEKGPLPIALILGAFADWAASETKEPSVGPVEIPCSGSNH